MVIEEKQIITFEGIDIEIDIDDYIEEFKNEINKDKDLTFEDKIYLEEEYDIKINNPFLNKYEISWNNTNNSGGGWNIKIGGVPINDDVFQNEKTNYDCIDIKSGIEDLSGFIEEKM